MTKLRLFRVQYSKPTDRGYNRTGNFSVVTTDLLRAAEICKENHPKCTVWSVHHNGCVDHIDRGDL